MKRLLLLAAAVLVMTVCNSQADGPSPLAPTQSATVAPLNVVVAFTSNRWTAEKFLIATGTFTNTNAVAIRVTKIIATGFDKDRKPITDDSGFQPIANFTIGDPEIAPRATAIFKVALSDPKKIIRFVKAIPYVEPIPPIPAPTPTPAPTPSSEAT
jgi:hypothetical protein